MNWQRGKLTSLGAECRVLPLQRLPSRTVAVARVVSCQRTNIAGLVDESIVGALVKNWIGLSGTRQFALAVESVKTEEFYHFRRRLPLERTLPEEYAIKDILIHRLVRLRWTAARQQRIEYLGGWFRGADRAIAAIRGYFRHPAF